MDGVAGTDHTASYGGYPAGSAERARIVNSTGRFRTSWLPLNHGVGFTFNEPYTRQCLTGAWGRVVVLRRPRSRPRHDRAFRPGAAGDPLRDPAALTFEETT